MFGKHSLDGYQYALEGITRKTLVYGEKTLMTEFVLKQGSALPRHSHPHEQTGYLVSGNMRITAGNEVVEVKPGDSWCIPSNVEHEAVILEDSIALEIFSPPRDDYKTD